MPPSPAWSSGTAPSHLDRTPSVDHPQQVILFGSYAYGKPTPDSDVDLLVVMPHENPPAVQAAEIRKSIHAGFPMDLLVRSPSEIRRRLAMGDSFIHDILERGQPLYEPEKLVSFREQAGANQSDIRSADGHDHILHILESRSKVWF